jgi:hypothetical protein
MSYLTAFKIKVSFQTLINQFLTTLLTVEDKDALLVGWSSQKLCSGKVRKNEKPTN